MSEDEGEAEEGSGAKDPPRWIPGPRLAPLAALGLPLALLSVLDGGGGLGLLSALAYDGLLMAASLFESRRLARLPLTITRELPARLIVGRPNTVTLRLHNRSARSLRVTVRDDLPPGFAPDVEESTLALPPFTRRTARYTVTPPKRGRFRFGDLHLKIEGRARLGASLTRTPSAAPVQVYPDILGPRRYELATRLGDPRRLGVRKVRRLGEGGELAQLREYVAGDPYRGLSWKASARRLRPISRVYQQERSQTVMLMLDIGRVMAPRLDTLTKLDHAINATLLLAHVALKNGDRVGLIVFAEKVLAYVPPKAGGLHYRRLLGAVYAQHARPTTTDFRRLAETLAIRVPKRALLVLFSDLLDELHALPLATVARTWRKKHLPVCVSMHDAVAEAMADQPVEEEAFAYARAAAADLLAEREVTKARLRAAGVDLVEASPGELAVAAVNRYLVLKARSAL